MIERTYKCDDCGINVSPHEYFRAEVWPFITAEDDEPEGEYVQDLGPSKLRAAGWCQACLDKHMPERSKRKPKEVPSMSNQREAFLQGYNAHKEGKQQTKSPYPFRNQDNPESLCQNWHAGWRKAAEDFREAADSFTASAPDDPEQGTCDQCGADALCHLYHIEGEGMRLCSTCGGLHHFNEAAKEEAALKARKKPDEGKSEGRSRYACRACGRVSPYELADVGGATRWVCPDCVVPGRSFEIPGGLEGEKTPIPTGDSSTKPLPRSESTPGPWNTKERILSDTAPVIEIFHPTGLGGYSHKLITAVATRSSKGGGQSREDVANARLIAAAPDLLAACKAALPGAIDSDDRSSEAQLRVAIARAERDADSGMSFELPVPEGAKEDPGPGDTVKNALRCMDCHSPVIGADGKVIVVPPGVESHGRCTACYEKIDRKKAENER